MAERVFVPARRGKTILVFEHRERTDRRQWDFVACAVRAEGAARVDPTGMVALTDAELAACDRVADGLRGLESYLTGITPVDLDSVPTALDMPPELALVEGSPLFTMTLYLQLQRTALVAEASLARYRQRPPAERVAPDLTTSVLTGLLRMHDIARAAEILDEDRERIESLAGEGGTGWASLLEVASVVRVRAGDLPDALALAERAHAAAAGSLTWRRLGMLRDRSGDAEGALAAFEAAEAAHPLPPAETVRLGLLLAAAGRDAEARRVAVLAAERGAADADRIRAALSAGAGVGPDRG